MFDNLTQRLASSLRKMSGKARLTEENLSETLAEVRVALLEADVALPVIQQFIDSVKLKSLGQAVSESLNPGQAFLKIVKSELELVMGAANEQLNLNVQPPAVILMAGLQGAGKTTTAAKLANLLKNNEKKKVLLTSADIYRPAAIDQLQALASQIKVDFFSSDQSQRPSDIAKLALDHAKTNFYDVLILDTAGRLSIDEKMMTEIAELHEILIPVETLLIVDAMTGQDAAITARDFAGALPLTGVVLTKADSDTRGGAALSVRFITGKPIKFIGVGEKIEALDPFYPERIASRILGMGDMLSLIEEVEHKVDKKKAERLAKKFKKGKSFDLEDFRDQLQQMNKLGGIAGMLDKLPAAGNLAQLGSKNVDNALFSRMEAIICSMTPRERRQPNLISGSRKRRITQGSGTNVQDLNRLLKQHKQMQKMMKKVKAGGVQKMLQGLGDIPPPGGGMGGSGGIPPYR
ncbi:MAG: signal recognition particle protein [Halieaceae bacterium]|nr:signal recognition particle protein [Halieaceae bacterium]